MAINLSGGLDSSSILLEVSLLGKNIQCFTTGFQVQNPKYKEDELFAKKLANHFNQKIEILNFSKNDYFENFKDSYSRIEEPNYNMALPLYSFISKKIGMNGAGFKVLFSGDGGDELFGGYDYYFSKNNYINLSSGLNVRF